MTEVILRRCSVKETGEGLQQGLEEGRESGEGGDDEEKGL